MEEQVHDATTDHESGHDVVIDPASMRAAENSEMKVGPELLAHLAERTKEKIMGDTNFMREWAKKTAPEPTVFEQRRAEEYATETADEEIPDLGLAVRAEWGELKDYKATELMEKALNRAAAQREIPDGNVAQLHFDRYQRFTSQTLKEYENDIAAREKEIEAAKEMVLSEALNGTGKNYHTLKALVRNSFVAGTKHADIFEDHLLRDPLVLALFASNPELLRDRGPRITSVIDSPQTSMKDKVAAYNKIMQSKEYTQEEKSQAINSLYDSLPKKTR